MAETRVAWLASVLSVISVKAVNADFKKSLNLLSLICPPGSRKFIIPSSVLMMAGAMVRPTVAARFLMRSLFSRQELLHGSIRGYTARGLKKLNPDKINAIRGEISHTHFFF